MGKIFTITEGLENMGALHTGGQGSVYKGRRIGEIFVAVKLLPTPIHAEDENDKHYKDFINEVEKLKKVNQVSNPNVVKILNSGITESGSLPFIEMEFIEGPDLAELLTEKDTPVFTIHEAIKVAYQLANALSHCHRVSVKHGDIKSNNVKFNINTGNYMLLDFGLAIMSDEQRRSSLRNAGAVEFMAPEQSEGNLLPQSDVYSYGIILYELLAGTVPFKLNDNGQTARNAVMIAHLEQEPPDLLTLREKNMPLSWPEDQRRREMQVPAWLLTLISKCLQKNPADRYTNGTELREVIQHSVISVKGDAESALILQNEKDALELKLKEEETKTSRLLEEITQLKNNQVAFKAAPVTAPLPHKNSGKSMSKAALLGIGLLLTCMGALAGHYLFNNGKAARIEPEPQNSIKGTPEVTVKKSVTKPKTLAVKKTRKDSAKKVVKTAEPKPKPAEAAPVSSGKGSDVGKVFTLFTTYAYFHSRPDEASKRAANINQWNNARLKALDDQNGFIYVVYTNDKGQTSKGWLRKKDLIVVGQ
ncbi:serine/threonine protein kinase [Mucilaginibacter terrenus]|uniref:Serine/threonine protein kinase n=1 Tax=Mucilaginibacter terrenus TaxID=2482727 RepID=A0A3E2NXP6_9SPHI|nr:serine/threonine protein kinase [Mucilaginibacter terrenus]RFZ85719.1 serine/threonine protein kinase [Mucilaginibacter terrenus]